MSHPHSSDVALTLLQLQIVSICLHCLPRLEWLASRSLHIPMAHVCCSLAFFASYQGPVDTRTLYFRRIHSVPPWFQCRLPRTRVLFLSMMEGVCSPWRTAFRFSIDDLKLSLRWCLQRTWLHCFLSEAFPGWQVECHSSFWTLPCRLLAVILVPPAANNSKDVLPANILRVPA